MDQSNVEHEDGVYDREAAKICKVSQQTIIRCFDNGTLKGSESLGVAFDGFLATNSFRS